MEGKVGSVPHRGHAVVVVVLVVVDGNGDIADVRVFRFCFYVVICSVRHWSVMQNELLFVGPAPLREPVPFDQVFVPNELEHGEGGEGEIDQGQGRVGDEVLGQEASSKIADIAG